MERIISEMGSSQAVTQQEVQTVLTQMSALFQLVQGIANRVSTSPPAPNPPDVSMMQALPAPDGPRSLDQTADQLLPGQRRITEFASPQPSPATVPMSQAGAAGGA